MNAIKTPDVARVTPANLIQLFFFLSFSSLIIFLSFRLNISLWKTTNRFSRDFVFYVIKKRVQ